MGILNVTPDSFSDGGRYFNTGLAIERGIEMASEGADILDIGGESTRPGSRAISVQEELDRVIPVIRALKDKLAIPISIDTKKPEVARAALQAGASIINDVRGFDRPEMCAVAKESGVPICVMHMQGTPETMQQKPFYQNGIVDHLLEWFSERIRQLIAFGIDQKQIILDPGIGFGKTVEDNAKIIQNIPKLKELGYPVLLGVSRKSFMTKIVGKEPLQLLNETIAVNTAAFLHHTDIVRVHNVKEHRSVFNILEAIYRK